MLVALAAGMVALGCAARAVLPDTSGGSAMGEKVAFTLPARDGSDVDVAKAPGEVALVDVWATWSDPCRDSLPLDRDLLAEYAQRGLRVYTVNVDRDVRLVDPFLEAVGVSVPVLLDRDAKVTDGILHVKQMPTLFLLDRKGVVRFIHEGFSEELRTALRSEIDELLAEPKPQ
jgi:thiol-disulfide isomerase/thioredoxin